eukprot:ctg_387.g188
MACTRSSPSHSTCRWVTDTQPRTRVLSVCLSVGNTGSCVSPSCTTACKRARASGSCRSRSHNSRSGCGREAAVALEHRYPGGRLRVGLPARRRGTVRVHGAVRDAWPREHVELSGGIKRRVQPTSSGAENMFPHYCRPSLAAIPRFTLLERRPPTCGSRCRPWNRIRPRCSPRRAARACPRLAESAGRSGERVHRVTLHHENRNVVARESMVWEQTATLERVCGLGAVDGNESLVGQVGGDRGTRSVFLRDRPWAATGGNSSKIVMAILPHETRLSRTAVSKRPPRTARGGWARRPPQLRRAATHLADAGTDRRSRRAAARRQTLDRTGSACSAAQRSAGHSQHLLHRHFLPHRARGEQAGRVLSGQLARRRRPIVATVEQPPGAVVRRSLHPVGAGGRRGRQGAGAGGAERYRPPALSGTQGRTAMAHAGRGAAGVRLGDVLHHDPADRYRAGGAGHSRPVAGGAAGDRPAGRRAPVRVVRTVCGGDAGGTAVDCPAESGATGHSHGAPQLRVWHVWRHQPH